jgi:DNA-binding CsgD family transcriptional regulator
LGVTHMANQMTSPHPPKSSGGTLSTALTEERRDSGIRVLGKMSWGSHICVFYETEQDLLDTNIAYFEAGLEANEFCVWVLSDPTSDESAKDALLRSIPDIDRRLESGQIELMLSADWYLHGGEFDLQRITGGWDEKLRKALAKGFVGMRVSGNAFWIGTSNWKEFCAYEQEIDQSLAGQAMIVLCTYSLSQSRTFDLPDVARAHQFTVIRRKGEWEILETPDLKQAKREIRKLNAALNVLSGTFPGHKTLTSRESIVLTQIVRGFSSKEIARTLGITPRTVEFHRANLLMKTNARNTVDLVRIALGK